MRKVIPIRANPNPPPRQTGGTWPDYAIASAVTFHLLAALRHRNRTGEGQWIDASMGETVIGQMPEWYMDYFMNGRDRRARGNRDDVMAPHNTYHMRRRGQVDRDRGRQRNRSGKRYAVRWVTRSGHATRSSPTSTAAGSIATSSMRTSRSGRASHDILALAKELQSVGVAAGPVLDSVEIHDDPHLWEWGFFRKIRASRGRRPHPAQHAGAR